MATLGTLWTNVSEIIGLDNTGGGQEQLMMTRRANEAVRDILLRTRVTVTQDTTTLTPGVSDYQLPQTVLRILEAYITSSGTAGRLQVTSPEEILRLRRGIGSSPVTQLALQGSDYLMMWPTPTLADVITFYMITKPTEMSSTAHDPATATYGGIPVEYHPAIEFYMLWRCADYDDDATSQMGDRYRAMYEQELVKIRRAGNAKLGRTTGIPIPGQRRTRYGLQPSQIGV